MTAEQTDQAPSAWHCTSCKQRVSLATAREHYDRCDGGDRDDEADNDCGCGRAFVGMTSRRSTTTAIITELDITYEQLRGIVAALDHQQGADPEDVDAMTAQLLDMARDYDTGSIAGILRYNLRARS